MQRISNKVVVTKTTLQTAGQDTTFNTQWKLTTGQKYIDLSSTNKDNKVMTLNGYQHGQSLEIFTYKSKQYLLMTAGTVGKNDIMKQLFVAQKKKKKTKKILPVTMGILLALVGSMVRYSTIYIVLVFLVLIFIEYVWIYRRSD